MRAPTQTASEAVALMPTSFCSAARNLDSIWICRKVRLTSPADYLAAAASPQSWPSDIVNMERKGQ